MVTKERLREILSFVPFFNFVNKRGIIVLNDYMFMNPKFFDADDINSESGSKEIWYLIDERKSEFIMKALTLIVVYESQLDKINVREYLIKTLNISNTYLTQSFNNFFIDFELKNIKEKYGFDIKEFYFKYIEGK
jgi:hypothetical protein